MVSVIPDVSLTVSWKAPEDFGCLPLISYALNKNGVDLATVISPNALFFIDTSLTTGGSTGTQIVYKLKAINSAGPSPYTEDLTVTVGLIPNAPTNLRIVK